MLARYAFAHYPNHKQPFYVNCDANNYKFDAAMFLNDYLVAYYSHKLNSLQKHFITGRKEIFSIIEIFKEYCSELQLNIDHRNLTFDTLSIQKML